MVDDLENFESTRRLRDLVNNGGAGAGEVDGGDGVELGRVGRCLRAARVFGG